MTHDDGPELPFPRRWTAPLGDRGYTWLSPLIRDGVAIWRSALEVAAVDVATGAPRWRCRLDDGDGDGEVLVAAGELTITDGWLRAEQRATLHAIDGGGRRVWTTDVEMTLSRDSVLADGERVLARGTDRLGGPDSVLPLDAATGRPRARTRLPLGGTNMTAVPGGLVVRDTTATPERIGLYFLGADGEARALERGACWRAVYTGGRVVALQHGGGLGELQVRDGATLAVRWRAPVAAPGGDADGEHVAAIVRERAGGPPLLALHDAATGEVRWRADPRTAEDISTVVLAGPVVMVSSLDGCAFFRRRDGAWLGRTEDTMAPPVAAGELLIVGAPGVLVAADLAGI